MIDLDTSRLPSRVVAALMARGAQLPPLQWHTNPIRAAKSTLDGIPNTGVLVDCDPPVDEAMAAAVRALLYFWNGWFEEAESAAAAAPEQERTYITALIKRQTGDAAAAKVLFQEVGDHAVHPHLVKFTQDTIGLSVMPLLKRLRDMIAFVDQWEPHIFVDVYEHARAGGFDPSGELMVCTIQCREFELLFSHCLEAATGRKCTKPAKDTAEQQRVRRRPPARRPTTPFRHSPTAAKPSAPKEPVKLALDVTVICPGCGATLTVPEEKRGTTQACAKCNTAFLVPERQLT